MLVKDFLLYRDYLNEDEINCLFSLIGTINEDMTMSSIAKEFKGKIDAFEEKWIDDCTKKLRTLILVKKSELNQNKIVDKYNGTTTANKVIVDKILDNPREAARSLFNAIMSKKINNDDGIPTINSKHINTSKQDMMRQSDAIKYNKG